MNWDFEGHRLGVPHFDVVAGEYACSGTDYTGPVFASVLFDFK